MSILYSSIYLATNIIGPIGYMIYTQIKSLSSIGKSQTHNTLNTTSQQKSFTGNLGSQNKIILDNFSESFYKCNYGKWAALIFSILLFNLLYTIFSKSLIVILLGLIVKTSILYAPNSISNSVQNVIQRFHFQVYLYTITSKAIELYLDLSEKINFFMVFYSTKERDEQLSIFNRMKDSVSRIELELEDNQQIKNRSFIVAVKKMQSMPKKCKSYENIAVTCDILKGSSEVGKQLLKILQEKTLSKQRSQNPNISKVQQPTKDKIMCLNIQGQRSAIYPSRSQSLQQKIQIMKQTVNIPTSQKKRVNQVRIKETPFVIKRSQTDIGEDFQFEHESPSRNRENHHIGLNNNSRTHKVMTRQQNKISQINTKLSNKKRPEENTSSLMSNDQNVAVLDIIGSEKSQNKKGNLLSDVASLGRILQSEELVRGNGIYASLNISQEPTSPRVLPPGLNISSIQQNPIHPFKVNLSSLSNPLIMSNNFTKSKILPNSMVTSNQYQIISSSKKQSSILNLQPNIMPQKQLSNISQAKTQNINTGGHFSQESSILNKHQVSINESDYSDMFDSSDEEEQTKLEIKVQVIVLNEKQKGLRPRMDICYIELYQNSHVKFMSMHDKLMFHGKLARMHKIPQNYYELVILESKSTEQTQKQKKFQQQPQQVQVVRKVKFRGQARPFMKYLEKL